MKQHNKLSCSITINNAQSMIELGRLIGGLVQPCTVIALTGELGSGKTTLTKGIGQALGVTEVINSPTFTIMKIYPATKMAHLYHLDVYRVGSQDFDLEDYFYQNGLIVIEWAELVSDILPDDCLNIELKVIRSTTRAVKIFSNNQGLMQELLAQIKAGGFVHD